MVSVTHREICIIQSEKDWLMLRNKKRNNPQKNPNWTVVLFNAPTTACNSVFWESLENSVFQFFFALLLLFTMATNTNVSKDYLRRGLRKFILAFKTPGQVSREQRNIGQSDKALSIIQMQNLSVFDLQLLQNFSFFICKLIFHFRISTSVLQFLSTVNLFFFFFCYIIYFNILCSVITLPSSPVIYCP